MAARVGDFDADVGLPGHGEAFVFRDIQGQAGRARRVKLGLARFVGATVGRRPVIIDAEIVGPVGAIEGAVVCEEVVAPPIRVEALSGEVHAPTDLARGDGGSEKIMGLHVGFDGFRRDEFLGHGEVYLEGIATEILDGKVV